MHFKHKLSPTLLRATKASQQGFTLIEIIVGIVVLSIAFSIFTSLIYPLANQSAKQVHQIKAAELGQSMINEIIAKAFDENSDKSGGVYRCGESGETACSSTMGPEGSEAEESEKREQFDDVDDYNNLLIIKNSLGDSLNDIYVGYQINVKVINDSDYDGDHDDADNNFTAKLMTVTVTTPQGVDFVFAVYRVNF